MGLYAQSMQLLGAGGSSAELQICRVRCNDKYKDLNE